MAKRTTISDLARALSLSPTLISMVLNGKGDQNKISKDTQKRVLEMADKMGYTPNASARALRTGKSHVIGLIVPDISNAFYSGLAKHFEEMLQAKGYRLIVGSTDEVEEKEVRLMRVLIDQNVDGLIVASTLKDISPYKELVLSGKPVVFFDRIFNEPSIPSVSVENRNGASKAIDLFHEAGRKYIGFLTLGPAHISPLEERRKGFIEACKSHNISDCENRVLEIPFSEIQSNFNQLFQQFVDKHPELDAILVANNNLAFQLMKFKKSSDNSKIKNMAMISFDDHLAFELSDPGVTSISQPISDIAQSAVTIMLEALNKQNVAGTHVELPVKLVKRGSH